jgi:hypothetical protein
LKNAIHRPSGWNEAGQYLIVSQCIETNRRLVLAPVAFDGVVRLLDHLDDTFTVAATSVAQENRELLIAAFQAFSHDGNINELSESLALINNMTVRVETETYSDEDSVADKAVSPVVPRPLSAALFSERVATVKRNLNLNENLSPGNTIREAASKLRLSFAENTSLYQQLHEIILLTSKPLRSREMATLLKLHLGMDPHLETPQAITEAIEQLDLHIDPQATSQREQLRLIARELGF